MKKRIFSIVLALCMVLTMMPTVAFAISTPPDFSDGWKALEVDADGVISTTIEGGGHYYLADDLTIKNTLTISIGTSENPVVIDLNGNVLQYDNTTHTNGSVINVKSGANLTLQDSNPNKPHYFTKNTDGLWVWDSNVTEASENYKTVNGGVITGGTGMAVSTWGGCYGGGVNVEYIYYNDIKAYIGGTFTMNGGNIVGCTANYGGGISSVNANVTMNAGYVIGCTAKSGGGVYVISGNFTMEGGGIKYCKATSSNKESGGGGIYIYCGGTNTAVFYMCGGEISYCTSAMHGGGVFVNDEECEFHMAAGTIENCTANKNENGKGDGVYIRSEISVNKMIADGGTIANSVYVGSEITHSEGASNSTIFNGTVENDGTINCGTFDNDVTNSGTIKNGTFNGSVTNNGNIEGGIFYGVVTNNATISGGTFYGGITGTGTISGTPQYTVSFDLNGGSGNVPVTQVFVGETSASALKPAVEPSREGYTFDGWYNGNTEYDFDEYVSADITLIAHWQKNSTGSHTSYVQKPTISFGSADVTTETAADGSTVYTTAEGKLILAKDGRTATIVPNEDYEVASVTVNGTEKGTVTTLTGLRTGDKVVVTFKQTAEAQKEAETAFVKSAVKNMSLVARSSKTAKKNIKVTLKTDADTTAAISDLKDLGYTLKYKYYRSTKKSSAYTAKATKTSKSYTNTSGKKGTKYYYKARVQVYDADGKLVAQTALKQCKYASRIWSK